MPDNTHFYQPKDGHQLEHDPFNSIIAPRPIGWISSKSPNGQVNLAPYSFFNAFNYHPPIIGFSSIGYKDSVKNAADSGEFCWNLVTRSLADMMNQTSIAVGSDVDEFELANIAKGQSKVIDVPHVADRKSMLPASRLLPAASKQPGKQPQQAATASSHSKQPQHQ